MQDKILIERYPNKWAIYYKDFDHVGGGTYYHSDDCNDFLLGGWISLYPDNHLTYLWNGVEHTWDVKWKFCLN